MTAVSARVAPPILGRRIAALVLIGSVVAALAIGVMGLGGVGASGPLRWSGDGEVFTHPTLPGDRVLTGTLRNDGVQAMRIDLADVRVVDGDGEVVASTPVFLRAFGKSLWGGGRAPEQMADNELQRTGRIALLAPGEELPLTVAWRTKDGDPVRVDYGRGSLSLPG
jgi:hypothetical protein